jgi:hypothetical protein
MPAMKPKTSKAQANYRLVILGFFSSVPLSLLLGTNQAQAQIGLTDDMANESASEAWTQQAKSMDYTYKNGDFRMLLTPALSLQYNDNINLTQTGTESDMIVLPTLGVTASYPLTTRNLLQLNVTGGYSDYVEHPHLSSWYFQSGSGLAFNLYIKDILVNIHDQFSYVQNSAQNAQVAGTGSYGTFQNSAGLRGDWSLKYFQLTAGYDHQNTIATSSQFGDDNNSTETGYANIGYKLNPKLTAGVQGTVAYTAYDQNTLNDNTTYSAGVFADYHPNSAIHFQPSVGYIIDHFEQTSQFIQTSDLNSWYADLTLTHQLTRSFSYMIDAGHNANLGVESDANEYWHVNTSVTWNFIRNFSLTPQAFYQHGKAGVGSTTLPPTIPPIIPPSNLLTQPEVYNYYGGGIAFNYMITKRFTVTLNYGITQRTSSLSNRGYTQNIVGIQLTYRPI